MYGHASEERRWIYDGIEPLYAVGTVRHNTGENRSHE